MIGGRAAPWIGLVLMGCPTPYEPPEHPEVRVDTSTMTAEEAADAVIAAWERNASAGASPT